MNGPEYVAHFPAIERFADALAQGEAFRRDFGTEEACRRWFFRARWPEGFRCPICGGRGRPMNSRRVIECLKCRRQTSLTAGTLLHGTRKPLRTWFEAAYLIVQRGVNARTLQRQLKLTYKVAWSWGHKLRAAMKARVVPKDADEAERLELAASRVRWGWLRRPDPARPGPCCSRLCRRDWEWPNELEEDREARRAESDYRRGIRKKEVPMPEDLPPGGLPWAKWELLATFKGSLSEKHLLAYLDEYAFRKNRQERPVTHGFASVARALATLQPLTYRRIVAAAKPAGHALSIFRTSPRPRRDPKIRIDPLNPPA